MAAPDEEISLTQRSRWLVLAFVYAASALFVYRAALGGGFVSDDIGYLMSPWVRQFDAAAWRAILDPTGPAAAYIANYAPVHLLAHAVAFQAFGESVTPHHVLNLLLHAGVATMLVALWGRAGLSFPVAAFLGAVFLLHPANVEAVAWISQLKSVLALALACLALLLEPRRSALAAAAFALALLTKFQAAFALPVALLWLWQSRENTPPHASSTGPRRRGVRSPSARLGWLAVWGLALLLIAIPQIFAFERLGHASVSVPDAGVERLRFLFSLLGRYLVMAASSWGVSAFHQPDPPSSWGNGWVLVGALGTAAIGARALAVLARGRAEAVWWAWAAAALLPVSQLLPFLYPLADRYLYFVLPGLLGALALALEAPLGRRLTTPRARLVLAAPALALLVAFAVRSEDRASLWRSDAALTLDAAAHYPRGLSALALAASEAARRGDVDAAVAALRAAIARGFDHFGELERNPGFAAIREDPRFRAVVAEAAGAWIETVSRRGALTPQELLVLGQAHRARGEWDRALASLAAAAEDPGPTGAQARAELVATRVARLRAERAVRGAATERELQEASDGTPPP